MPVATPAHPRLTIGDLENTLRQHSRARQLAFRTPDGKVVYPEYVVVTAEIGRDHTVFIDIPLYTKQAKGK